jgi:predicted kinase
MLNYVSGPAVILVNGLPGAGKTTLARALSQRLRLPLYSKDVIKEAHADVLGAEPAQPGPQRRWNASLGAAASDTMWALLADSPGGAILESCWPADFRGLAAAGLARAGIEHPLEIYCDVPLAEARSRFEKRHPRHPVHGALPGDGEWEHWRRTAEPLRLGPTLRVATTGPVDLAPVIAWIVKNAPIGAP